MTSQAGSRQQKIMAIVSYGSAITVGFACVAFAFVETLLLGSFNGSYMFMVPLLPLFANIVYLVWVLMRVSAGVRSNEAYRTTYWLPPLIASVAVTLFNYLLWAFIASWDL